MTFAYLLQQNLLDLAHLYGLDFGDQDAQGWSFKVRLLLYYSIDFLLSWHPIIDHKRVLKVTMID